MLIDDIIDRVKTSTRWSRLWDLHERWSPLRFFRYSEKLVEGEMRKLGTCLEEKRRVVIIYDQTYAPPGLGDILSVAMLARLVSSRTETLVVLSDQAPDHEVNGGNFRDTSSSKAKFIFEKVAPACNLLLEHELGAVTDGSELTLFQSEIEAGRDMSRYVLLLIRNLILEFDFELAELGFLGFSKGEVIGYPVRRTKIAEDRNSNEEVFLRDIRFLINQFPGMQVKLFGFQDEVSYFMSLLTRRGIASKVVPQVSTDFVSSTQEAVECSLWIQRLGGGIVLPILFSDVPFIFLSRDSVMARQLKLDTTRNRLFPWHGGDQIYFLSPLRASQIPIERFLKFIPGQDPNLQ